MIDADTKLLKVYWVETLGGDEKKGVFHAWGTIQGIGTAAIIEAAEDGQIHMVIPDCIRFIR